MISGKLVKLGLVRGSFVWLTWAESLFH